MVFDNFSMTCLYSDDFWGEMFQLADLILCPGRNFTFNLHGNTDKRPCDGVCNLLVPAQPCSDGNPLCLLEPFCVYKLELLFSALSFLSLLASVQRWHLVRSAHYLFHFVFLEVQKNSFLVARRRGGLLLLLLRVFRSIHDGGYIRRRMDVWSDCWWCSITNGFSRYVIEKFLWPRYWYSLSLSAPADHAPRSAAPWHTTT